jgi:uncharacterized protein with HEPN domain
MRDDRERLLDIQEAIADINKYAQQGRNAFETQELVQNWIIHHLLILGEAASRISEDFKEQHPDIPWTKIIGLRNILIHNYFGIDIDVVWSVVEEDLPELHHQIEELLG